MALLFVTNRGIGPWEPIDAQCYLSIAKSSPRLPENAMLYHYAQRLAVPYTIGAIARIVPVRIETLFVVLVYCSILAITAAWFALTSRCHIEMRLSFLMFAVFVFNPYSFRYYLIYPGMVMDLVFVVGVCLLSLGIVSNRLLLVYLGLVVTALVRQTALLLLPGLVVYLVLKHGSSLLRHFSFTVKWVVVPVLLTIVIYAVTSLVATNFSLPSRNLEHVSGVIDDLRRGIPLSEGVDFVGRLVLVFGLPISIASGIIPLKRDKAWTGIKGLTYSEKYLLALFGLWLVLIIAQPMLAGPSLTSDGVQRLTGLGSIPFLLAVSIVLQRFTDLKMWSVELLVLLGAVTFACSLHHTYTFFGEVPEEKARFALIYIGGCTIAFAATRFWSYRIRSRSNE